ncbi:hypothetical protein [Streptomyces sp. NPDC048341]|uniref:hypothetical protein n=1 Tax=Streptomyces sp. NPDC048341 TaxID=3154620 RepID=UPI003437408F
MNQPSPEEPRSITVPPRSMLKIELGEYPAAEEVPTFSYKCTPEVGDSIAASEHILDTDKGVRLVVHLQNFGNIPTEVTPLLAADSAA